MSVRRAVLLLGICVAVGAAGPAVALGDGDPASDALIAQNVFYPYSSPVPGREQNRLDADVHAAQLGGLDLKVAIIARSSDLGSITALYGAPQRYAEFLDTEISLDRRVPLLVVMPDGFGVQGLSARGDRAIAHSPPPRGDTGADLATAATRAVARLLSTADRRSRVASTGHATNTGRTVLLLALVLAALLVAGAIVVLRVFSAPTRA